MFVHVKKAFLIGVVALSVPLLFVGCQKKVSTGSCKEDKDCRVNAAGKEINGVCVSGSCAECREDTDCQGLQQCMSNRCETTCQVNADCANGQVCSSSGICVAENDLSDKDFSENDCKNIPNVRFAFDSFSISDEYRPSLDRVATCMETRPTMQITLEGHTDAQGTPTYNMILGNKRAQAVADYLIKTKGIASNRIKTVSYGEQRPVVSESNEEAYAQNRRAVFVLVF